MDLRAQVAGDESSHPEIERDFRNYAALVYRRALVLLGSPADAEDAVQEVFSRALKGARTFRGEAMTSTWLYRITTNYCLNQLRNSSRRTALLDQHSGEQPRFPGAPPADLTLVLRRLLADADPKQAQAAVYVYLDGMTRPEAAGALGVSLRTIGNLLNRFNAWAKERLEASAVPDSDAPGVEQTGAQAK